MNATPERPVELRAATLDDVAAVTAMLDTARRHWVDRPADADQTRTRLLTPHTEMELDTVVAEIGDDVVGFGHVWPAPPGEVRCFARTHPDHRGRGVGTALQHRLITRAEEWARRDGTAEPFITTTSWATDPSGDELLAALGYSAVRYYQKMVLTYADVDVTQETS